ncbi:ABC transporter substrate-binding protein [Nitrospinota bacterium]
MMKRIWSGFFLATVLLALQSCSGGLGDRPLAILVSVESRTFDPHFASSTIEWSFLMNIFDALVIRRDNMTLGPGLAERWEIDNTRKVWTFHLRKGVKFTNGEPFDARSVKFTFERMVNRKLRARTTIARRMALDRVEIVNDHTVRIHTRRPVATLPSWLVNAFMLAPKYYGETSPKEVLRKPVGTGPYKLVKWVKDDFIRMEANENWWKGKPNIEVVEWRPVPEVSARIAELEAGTADIITNISPDQGAMFARGERGNQLRGIHGGRRIYIGIRQNYEPFKDKRVRQAMNYAVNFSLIAQSILSGHGMRLATVVNPPNSDQSIKAYPYDSRKAKALLAEAGLKDTDGDGVLEKDGKPVVVKLDVPAARYLKGKEMSESIAENLRAVGIKVEVNPLEWSVYLSRRRKKAFSALYFHGFSSAFNAELDLGVLRPNLYANLTHWINPEFIEKYSRLGQTFDPKERKKISYRMQNIVYEDAPWIFLWNQYDFYGLSPRVKWIPRPDERIYLPSIVLKGAK